MDMSPITGWVRQIVVVGVLAGIAELALPRGSTRGYVRVVVGLLVMLTILEPVLGLMGNPVVWAQLGDWPQQVNISSTALSVDFDEVRERNDRLALDTYRTRLQNEIEAVVSRVEGLEVVRVTADVETRPERQDYGAILVVGIVVREAGDADTDVEPVEPIRLDEDQEESESQGEQGLAGEWPTRLESARKQLYELLRLHFGVPPAQVDLTMVH